MLGEFELINRYFKRQGAGQSTVIGVGDDCAVIAPRPGRRLAITTDTLVSGVHFFADVAPYDLGHKCLAVNFSDLAAMGATPRWVLLALTLPAANAEWLDEFAAGFWSLADRYAVDLIGGDTTRGPLSVTIQAIGELPDNRALVRSGAKVGDWIGVSGEIGDAGLALKALQGSWPMDTTPLDRLLRPDPRVRLGAELLAFAHSAIDISDGLAADLERLLIASGLGATIHYDALPLSTAVSAYIGATSDWQLPLGAGDDYELCFTISAADRHALYGLSETVGVPLTLIGQVESEPGLRVNRSGSVTTLSGLGFDHFHDPGS